MEIKNMITEGAFSKLEKPEKPANSFDDESLHQVGRERINSLKNSIKEIQYLVIERETLSDKFAEECEGIKTKIENFLLSTTAKDSDGFKERNGLREKQIEVSELQLNERVNCWRDVALLKKELREQQKELSEKEDRMAMLDGILE